MEVNEFREKAAKIGLPASEIEKEITDYLSNVEKGTVVMKLEDIISVWQDLWADGYVENH